MTLRQKNETPVIKNEEKDPPQVIRNERFSMMIDDLIKYLWCPKRMPKVEVYFGAPLIVVAPKNNNIYCNTFNYKMSYKGMRLAAEWSLGHGEPSDSDLADRWWYSCFNESDYKNTHKLETILKELLQTDHLYFPNRSIAFFDQYIDFGHNESPKDLKPYIIFWNLFLAAMDDDIYNEQLAAVAELAACFGFDEPMMRDWCRAVEYVFAGNKLSEDCDLECETVEGAKFFLHKEE